MAELQYPTNLDLGGPWLITAEQLEALDEIVDRQATVLQESARASLQKEVDEGIATYYASSSAEARKREEEKIRQRVGWRYSVKRDILIWLPDGKKLRANSFQEVSQHPEVAESRILGLDMEFGIARGTTSSFSIGGRWGKNLRLSVSGDDQQERERLFIALRNWVNDVKSPGWQRAWHRIASTAIHWLLWSFAIIVSAAILGAPERSPYTDAAHKLLAKGLESKDLTKALELILAFESNYRPGRNPASIPLWFWLVVIGGLAICVMLSVHPYIEFGLGHGKARLRLWNFWTRLVAVTIPIFVFTTVARNLISSVIARI